MAMKPNAKKNVRKKRNHDDTGPLMTPRAIRFVEEYLLDLNATQAALRAGYSKRSARFIGSENLTKPNIAAAIERAIEERSELTGFTQKRVLKELELLVFSDVSHYLVDDEGHVTLAEGAPKDAMRALSGLKRKVTVKEFGKTTITEYDIEFKLWDKPGPLKIAGRHVGLPGFSDRLELTGKNGQPLRSPVAEMSTPELKAALLEAAGKL